MTNRIVRILALAAILVSAAALAGRATAGHTPDPASVTVAGSLQSELGCPGDWQPGCASTHLQDDPGDDVWQGVFNVPGGPGVRLETFAHSDCVISPYYDSLIAKIVVHGRDRHEAIARMRRTLEMTVIEGIKTSIPMHLKILADPDFQAGKLSTAFMDRFASRPGAGTAESGRNRRICAMQNGRLYFGRTALFLATTVNVGMAARRR